VPCAPAPRSAARTVTGGVSVLDLIYVLGVLAVFALIGVVAWGVEKL
jgi:hypothetical protein